jgi:tetratricopeptide (TPR) repeat protein
VLTYRWLVQRGRLDQALLELRLAAEVAPGLVSTQVCQLANANPTWALAAAPRNKHRMAYLEMAATCVPEDHASAVTLDDALLQEFPSSLIGWERRALRLAAQGRTDDGLKAIAQLARIKPDYGRVHIVKAGILMRAGRLSAALEATQRGLSGSLDVDARSELLTIQARIYTQLKNDDGLHRSLAALRGLAGPDAARLAGIYDLEGQLEMSLAQYGAAFHAYREAYRIKPEIRYLAAVANLASGLGDLPQSLWAYIRLCQQGPAGSDYCIRRDQLLAPSPAEAR